MGAGCRGRSTNRTPGVTLVPSCCRTRLMPRYAKVAHLVDGGARCGFFFWLLAKLLRLSRSPPGEDVQLNADAMRWARSSKGCAQWGDATGWRCSSGLDFGAIFFNLKNKKAEDTWWLSWETRGRCWSSSFSRRWLQPWFGGSFQGTTEEKGRGAERQGL